MSPKQTKRHLQCATDPRPFRAWSDHDPSMIRQTVSPQPASQPRLLFALPTSILYWKIQRFTLRLSFQISPNAAPPTKSDSAISPSAVPATKNDTWTSPNAAPATKNDTWTSPNAAPATKNDTITWLCYYLPLRLLNSSITKLYYYWTLLLLDSTIT